VRWFGGSISSPQQARELLVVDCKIEYHLDVTDRWCLSSKTVLHKYTLVRKFYVLSCNQGVTSLHFHPTRPLSLSLSNHTEAILQLWRKRDPKQASNLKSKIPCRLKMFCFPRTTPIGPDEVMNEAVLLSTLWYVHRSRCTLPSSNFFISMKGLAILWLTVVEAVIEYRRT